MEFFTPETQKRFQIPDLVWPVQVNETTDPRTFLDFPIDKLKEPQAVPLPESQEPGYSPVYRFAKTKDSLLSTYHPKITTMYEAFEATVNVSKDDDALGDRSYDSATKSWGPYNYISYNQFRERRNDFAAGMVNVVEKHTGLTPLKKKYVPATYAPNCPNWIIVDMACVSQNLPSVCLYDTLGTESSEYILKLVECPVVIASLANIPKIFKLKPRLPELKVVICITDMTDEGIPAGGQTRRDILSHWGAELGVSLYSFSEVLAIGKTKPIVPLPPKREDIYTINFTSGTTGNPKGAIVTHAAVISCLTFSKAGVQGHPPGTPHAFSFLPLAHIYERMACLTAISGGYKISFPHGALTEIFEDIALCKPTVTDMVPRVLTRVSSALRASTIEGPGFAGAISRRAFAAKLAKLRATGDPSHPLWDRVWSKKIRAKLGFDNIHCMFSGSAPINKDDIEFLRCAFSCGIQQGYGLTESLSGICVAQINDHLSGSCGPIGVTTECRLKDCPSLGYTAADSPYPRGELQLRGPQMFSGYYKEEEKTKEAVDENGWFSTGDIAMIDKDGRIHIVGRVKNFFKLAQGEYIAPEKIEGVYSTACTMLSQVFVHGDSFQTYLVGIIGIDPVGYSAFVSHVLGEHHPASDLNKLKATFKNPRVRRAVLNYMNNSIPPRSLHGFEKIKNLRLFFEPLSIENDTITPTLKVRRPQAEKLFKNHIDEMYAEGPLELAKTDNWQHVAKL